MSALHNMRARGNIGEDAVCAYLEKHGCTILARNYTAPHGELDIVAESEHYLLFVEVKARREKQSRETAFGTPASAVTKVKQAHLISAAEAYLAGLGDDHKPPRLDVAEVYFGEGDPPPVLRIRYIPAAFIKS